MASLIGCTKASNIWLFNTRSCLLCSGLCKFLHNEHYIERCGRWLKFSWTFLKTPSQLSFIEDVTSTNVAMWFSPDGRYLAYAQSNDTQVKWFSYLWYGKYSDMYTTVKKIAYPKPGSPNPVVKIKMVDLNKLPSNKSQVPNTMDLNPPADFTNV